MLLPYNYINMWAQYPERGAKLLFSYGKSSNSFLTGSIIYETLTDNYGIFNVLRINIYILHYNVYSFYKEKSHLVNPSNRTQKSLALYINVPHQTSNMH